MLFRSVLTWELSPSTEITAVVHITHHTKSHRFRWTLEMTVLGYQGLHGVSSLWYFTLWDTISDALIVSDTSFAHFKEFITTFGHDQISKVTLIHIFNEIKAKYLVTLKRRDDKRRRSNISPSTASGGTNIERAVRRVSTRSTHQQRILRDSEELIKFWEGLHFKLD